MKYITAIFIKIKKYFQVMKVDIDWDESDDDDERKGKRGRRKGLPRKLTQMNTNVTVSF